MVRGLFQIPLALQPFSGTGVQVGDVLDTETIGQLLTQEIPKQVVEAKPLLVAIQGDAQQSGPF